MQSFDALPAPRKVAFGRGWRWIVEAFYIVRQQPLTWILLALAYLVINFIVSMIPLLGGPLSFFLAPVSPPPASSWRRRNASRDRSWSWVICSPASRPRCGR
ncbi:hypothetical protein JOS77_11625 [Chromobacterium haemolyticum]|nr:hypothetical protein JOS77_11625 [Chromobacterium haemolyticum]